MQSLFNLHDVIRNDVENLLMDVHTSIPAMVESFNNKTQLAVVKVAVNRPTHTGASIPAGTYHDVPIIFPAAAKWVIAGPVEKGDVVMLLIPHYGIEDYMAGDRTRTGDDNFVTRHDINSAVAIPGMYTFNSPTRKDSHQGKFHLANGESSVVLINEEDITIQVGTTILKVSAAGIDMTGIVTINGVPFGTHVHAFTDTGTGAVGASVTAPPT